MSATDVSFLPRPSTKSMVPVFFGFRFLGRKRVPEMPPICPATRSVIDLFAECDRIDAMPADVERDRALAGLLTQVRRLETEVPAGVRDAALREAMRATA